MFNYGTNKHKLIYLLELAQLVIIITTYKKRYLFFLFPSVCIHVFCLTVPFLCRPLASRWAPSVRSCSQRCSSAPCCGYCSSSPCACASSSFSRTTPGCLSHMARCPPQPKSGWSVLLFLFFMSNHFPLNIQAWAHPLTVLWSIRKLNLEVDLETSRSSCNEEKMLLRWYTDSMLNAVKSIYDLYDIPLCFRQLFYFFFVRH